MSYDTEYVSLSGGLYARVTRIASTLPQPDSYGALDTRFDISPDSRSPLAPFLAFLRPFSSQPV